MPDNIFIDTNVLIYLINENSSFHTSALKIFNNLINTSQLWISRQIIREYFAVTSKTGFVEYPLSSSEIIYDIKIFETIFDITDENFNTTTHLLELIEKYDISGVKIHDTNIVASMIQYGISHLFTYNITDFNIFDEIALIDIS